MESWQSVSEQDRLSPPSEPGPSTRFFAVELPAPPSESSSSSEEEENNAAPAGGVRGSPPAPASAPAVANGHAPPPHASAADGSLPTAPPPPPLHNQRQPTWENLSSGGPRIPGGMNSSSSTTVPTGAIASGVNGAPAAPEKPLHDQSILYIIVFHNFSFLSGSTISRRYAAFFRDLPIMTPDPYVPITRSIKMSAFSVIIRVINVRVNGPQSLLKNNIGLSFI